MKLRVPIGNRAWLGKPRSASERDGNQLIATFWKANVRTGKREKLLEFLKWDCQVARDDEPATLRFDVFEDPTDDNVVFVYEAYVDQAGFEVHKLGEPFKTWIGGLMDECVESVKKIVPGWTAAFCTTAE